MDYFSNIRASSVIASGVVESCKAAADSHGYGMTVAGSVSGSISQACRAW